MIGIISTMLFFEGNEPEKLLTIQSIFVTMHNIDRVVDFLCNRKPFVLQKKFCEYSIFLKGNEVMGRYEKNEITKKKIIDNAMIEFSKKSYNESSINLICTNGQISKGIIYHYFKDKDELYLFCVKKCFDDLTDYLSKMVKVNGVTMKIGLEQYFNARLSFFRSNPISLGLFCSAVLNPPNHLVKKILNVKSNLHAQSFLFFTTLLESALLREDITIAEVVDVFEEYQDFMNAGFQKNEKLGYSLDEYEKRCRRSLQIILYGVIKNENK